MRDTIVDEHAHQHDEKPTTLEEALVLLEQERETVGALKDVQETHLKVLQEKDVAWNRMHSKWCQEREEVERLKAELSESHRREDELYNTMGALHNWSNEVYGLVKGLISIMPPHWNTEFTEGVLRLDREYHRRDI